MADRIKKKYFIKEKFAFREDKILLTFEAIIDFIKSYKEKSNNVRIITDLDLEHILITLKDQYGIIATELQAKNGIVSRFGLEQNGVIFRISNMRMPENESKKKAINKESSERYFYCNTKKSIKQSSIKTTYPLIIRHSEMS